MEKLNFEEIKNEELKCKEHLRQIEGICGTCKELMCLKCNIAHLKKGCMGIIDLQTFAMENLVPTYEKMLKSLEIPKNEKNPMSEFSKSIPQVKKGLIQIKIRTEKLLENVNKTLEILRDDELNFVDLREIKRQEILTKFKKLQEDIKNENILNIVKEIKSKKIISLDEKNIGDGEEQLLKATTVALSRMMELKESDKLNECLISFAELCKKIVKPLEEVVVLPKEKQKSEEIMWNNSSRIFRSNRQNHTARTTLYPLLGYYEVKIRLTKCTSPSHIVLGISTIRLEENHQFWLGEQGDGNSWREYGLAGNAYYKATNGAWANGSLPYKENDVVSICYNKSKQITIQVNGETFCGFSNVNLDKYYFAATLYYSGDEIEIIDCKPIN